ncbi:MAG TPA: LacI family DNA-binding transcriptional regulator [Devosiaceae bacterium]|nr:LacI family DNA-binding transcriptional regulator [Devosiaceae bacterium]
MKGIRRLADHLDISIGTVSRALNGRPDVSEETRRRVLEAAAAMGYVPNQSGRALRKGTTSIIGFMIETGTNTGVDGDTFFLTVFDGVQTVLGRHGLDLVALLCGSEEDPDAYLRRVVGRGFVDGLIISATQRHDPRIDFLADRSIPFIALGRSLTDRGQPWYDLDFEGMAEQAVDRFVARGHRRIAVAAPASEVNLGYVLIDSYRRALARHGLPFDPALVLRSPQNQAGGYAMSRALLALEARPTAILMTGEMLSIGLYRGLIEAGVIPGRDIAVIGRDNPHARFLSPTLTSFRTSLRDLGIALAEALLATFPAYAEHYPVGTTRRLWPMTLTDGQSDLMQVPPQGALSPSLALKATKPI